jgi:hypothetical protein
LEGLTGVVLAGEFTGMKSGALERRLLDLFNTGKM